MGTVSKAIAGGVAGPLTVLALYGLQHIPWIASMPPEPAAALKALVAAGIGFLLVYVSPANTTRGA